MGFLFKKSDKSKKREQQAAEQRAASGDESSSDAEQGATASGETTTATTSPKVKKRQSVRRNLSSNSMRKIRELAACLQIMGDEMETKRLSGAYSIADPTALETPKGKSSQV